MYKDNFVVAVKVDGKILREKKDIVSLPFGSEYAIYLKNLEYRRALINVFIDGDNVTPNGLVLNGQQTFDLERFIRNGNLDKGNRFKFIERTSAVEEGRSIKAEDGLIRVEVKFEQNFQFYYPVIKHWSIVYPTIYYLASISNSNNPVMMGTSAQLNQNSQCSVQNDVGITVPGSVSNQKFINTWDFVTESEIHTIAIRLVGQIKDTPVVVPQTVDIKPKCVTCKKVNKAISNYCSRCGTALEII